MKKQTCFLSMCAKSAARKMWSVVVAVIVIASLLTTVITWANGEAQQTQLVSVTLDCANGGNNNSSNPAVSADGRFVAFLSSASNLADFTTSGQQVFRRDVVTGTTTLVSVNLANMMAAMDPLCGQ